MAQIVAHIKFLLDHGTHGGIVGQFGAQRLEHHPLAVLLGGVDVVELLIPLGEVLNLGPFFGGFF